MAMGFAHVQASPLTRSSYHAREAAGAAFPNGASPNGGSPNAASPVAVPSDARPPSPTRKRPTPADDLVTELSPTARASRVTRMDSVRERMEAVGVDALLLSHGADLPWLTGYEAMPLERLTVLVLPLVGDPTLVVPDSEAPASPWLMTYLPSGPGPMTRIPSPSPCHSWSRGRRERADGVWPSPTGPGLPPSSPSKSSCRVEHGRWHRRSPRRSGR